MATQKSKSKRKKKTGRGLGNPMAVMAAGDAVKKMTPAQKGMLIGGSILVIGLVSFAGYKLYQKVFGTTVDESNKEMSDNLRSLTVYKSSLTISADKAMMMAQTIFDAMNKNGTDEDIITEQLESLKSQSDLLYVIKAFGVKNYGTRGESDSWIAKKIGYATPLNMSGWIKQEIKDTSDYYKRIKAVYNKFNVPF